MKSIYVTVRYGPKRDRKLVSARLPTADATRIVTQRSHAIVATQHAAKKESKLIKSTKPTNLVDQSQSQRPSTWSAGAKRARTDTSRLGLDPDSYRDTSRLKQDKVKSGGLVALPTAGTLARLVASHQLRFNAVVAGGPPSIRPGICSSANALDEVPPLHFGVIPFLLTTCRPQSSDTDRGDETLADAIERAATSVVVDTNRQPSEYRNGSSEQPSAYYKGILSGFKGRCCWLAADLDKLCVAADYAMLKATESADAHTGSACHQREKFPYTHFSIKDCGYALTSYGTASHGMDDVAAPLPYSPTEATSIAGGATVSPNVDFLFALALINGINIPLIKIKDMFPNAINTLELTGKSRPPDEGEEGVSISADRASYELSMHWFWPWCELGGHPHSCNGGPHLVVDVTRSTFGSRGRGAPASTGSKTSNGGRGHGDDHATDGGSSSIGGDSNGDGSTGEEIQAASSYASRLAAMVGRAAVSRVSTDSNKALSTAVLFSRAYATGGLHPLVQIECAEFVPEPDLEREAAINMAASLGLPHSVYMEAGEHARGLAAEVASAADSSRTRGMASAARHAFRVKILPEAAMIMDLHAHCSQSEVIGLLAGTFDDEQRILWITKAFSCRALAMEEQEPGGEWKDDLTDAETNVELDPVSEMEVRSQVRKAGLQVVGWYHSHPAFGTTPSLKDCENQLMLYAIFSHDGSESSSRSGRMTSRDFAPFVGLIISPYNPAASSSHSDLNGFYVVQQKGVPIPFRVPLEFEGYSCIRSSSTFGSTGYTYTKIRDVAASASMQFVSSAESVATRAQAVAVTGASSFVWQEAIRRHADVSKNRRERLAVLRQSLNLLVGQAAPNRSALAPSAECTPNQSAPVSWHSKGVYLARGAEASSAAASLETLVESIAVSHGVQRGVVLHGTKSTAGKLASRHERTDALGALSDIYTTSQTSPDEHNQPENMMPYGSGMPADSAPSLGFPRVLACKSQSACAPHSDDLGVKFRMNGTAAQAVRASDAGAGDIPLAGEIQPQYAPLNARTFSGVSGAKIRTQYSEVERNDVASRGLNNMSIDRIDGSSLEAEAATAAMLVAVPQPKSTHVVPPPMQLKRQISGTFHEQAWSSIATATALLKRWNVPSELEPTGQSAGAWQPGGIWPPEGEASLVSRRLWTGFPREVWGWEMACVRVAQCKKPVQLGQAIDDVWELMNSGSDPRLYHFVAVRGLQEAHKHLAAVNEVDPAWNHQVHLLSEILNQLHYMIASRRRRFLLLRNHIPRPQPSELDDFNDSWDRLDSLWDEVVYGTDSADQTTLHAPEHKNKTTDADEGSPRERLIKRRRVARSADDMLASELEEARRARFHERRRTGPVLKLLLRELASREDEVLELRRKAYEDKSRGRQLGQRALADAADVPLNSLLHSDETGSMVGRIMHCIELTAAGHALISRYGPVLSGPLAQVVDIAMYYRTFARKVDLLSPWKGTKAARGRHATIGAKQAAMSDLDEGTKLPALAEDPPSTCTGSATVPAGKKLPTITRTSMSKYRRSSTSVDLPDMASDFKANTSSSGDSTAVPRPSNAYLQHPGRARGRTLDKLRQALSVWIPLLAVPESEHWRLLNDISDVFELAWSQVETGYSHSEGMKGASLGISEAGYLGAWPDSSDMQSAMNREAAMSQRPMELE